MDNRDQNSLSATRTLSLGEALTPRPVSARRRVEEILAHPRPREVVAAIPVQEFYYLVRELGLADATELLALASGEQLRTCLDFEVWDRDRVQLDRLQEWLAVFVDEFLPGRLSRVMEELDLELLALWLHRSCKIIDRTLDQEEHEEALPAYVTPDTFFELRFPPTTAPGTAELIERFFERLYAADQQFARRLLQEAKWGLATELEETAYRWRQGRMEDLGFVEFYEALAAYAYLPPEQAWTQRADWRPRSPREEAVLLPAPLGEGFGEGGFFVEALRRIEDRSFLEDLAAAFVALANRALSADRVFPGDLDRVREVAGRVVATLSLGLEKLAAGDLTTAIRVLGELPLLTIFRVGFSLTVDLARVAQRLHQRGIDDPNLDPLLAPRPLYPLAFDDPPRAGARPFRSLADLDRVRRYLQETYAQSEDLSK